MQSIVLAVSTFMLFVTVASSAFASTHYLSPTGDDANPGASSQPWKTFAYALPRLRAGDTLVLKDGEYTLANSGFPYLDGKQGAASGTEAAPIALRAEHERMAFLHGDGSVEPLQVYNVSYWTFEGLRIESADDPKSKASGGGIWATNNHHLVFRRLLLRYNNRYANSHLMGVKDSPYCLVEECEFYNFHRHALSLGDYVTVRRCYFNSREWADIPGGYGPSDPADRGDNAIVVYPGNNNLVENCISEGNGTGFGIEAEYGPQHGRSDDNTVKGMVLLGDTYGVTLHVRCLTAKPRRTRFENVLAIGSFWWAIGARGAEDTQINHLTAIDGRHDGIVADNNGWEEGPGGYSIFMENSIVTGGGGRGFALVYQDLGWRVNYSNSYGNRIDWEQGASDPHITNALSLDPKWATPTRVWISDGPAVNSPILHKAGKGGEDVGANILYRYQNGVLTKEPLWDPKTGEFPHGAVIPGVNDIPGSSAFDVHERLNVRPETLPAGYGGGPTQTPSASVRGR